MAAGLQLTPQEVSHKDNGRHAIDLHYYTLDTPYSIDRTVICLLYYFTCLDGVTLANAECSRTKGKQRLVRHVLSQRLSALSLLTQREHGDGLCLAFEPEDVRTMPIARPPRTDSPCPGTHNNVDFRSCSEHHTYEGCRATTDMFMIKLCPGTISGPLICRQSR